MSQKFLLIAVVAFCFAPIKADNVTEIIQAGNEKIEEWSNNVLTAITTGKTTISETKDYTQKTKETFSQEGQQSATTSQGNLNATADDLFAQAITSDDPIKTLECIAKAHNTAIQNIDNLLSTLKSDLQKEQTNGDATIELAETVLGYAESSLPGLLETNKGKISTCVSQTCVDNNLGPIEQGYVTLSNNVKAEEDKVKQFRATFSQNTSNLLQKYQTNVSNAENTGNKQMKKCL